MAVSEEECSNAKSRSSSPSSSSSSAGGPHYLAKCVVRGSAVLQVAYGHIRSPSSDDVVFGKETSIELVCIGEDGTVRSICDQPVFGIIKDLALIPWNEKFRTGCPQQMLGRDLLAVVSDSGKLSFLTFCNEMHRFFPLTHVQLSSPGNSRHHLGRMLVVDSSGCYVATSAFVDGLALFSLSRSCGSNIVGKSLSYPPEDDEDTSFARSLQRPILSGTIWSMCFVSRHSSLSNKEHNPVLAIILNGRGADDDDCQRGALLNELLLLECNMKDGDINVVSQYVEDGPLAHNIVEVPRSNGFAFLFRIGDALLMDLRDIQNPYCVHRTSLTFLPSAVEERNIIEDSYRVLDIDDDVAACALLQLGDSDPMCIDSEGSSVKAHCNYLCSWSWEPGNDKNPRMIFCLDSGEFHTICISFGSKGPKVDHSECLYKGLPCKAMLWVKGGYVAALVEMGDGIVLKVENGGLFYTSSIQNIAPILGMSIEDYHDEKCNQLFASCGVTPGGSLRIVRSGIRVEKLLRTAPTYQGITGNWTVRMKKADLHHSFLVLSFVEETRVLSVGVNFSDVTDSVGFRYDVCTLACGLVVDGLLVQIHQNAVQLCMPTNVAHVHGIPLSSPVCVSWVPDNLSISLGAVKHNLIIVSTSNPCSLYILGVRSLSAYQYEISEMQCLKLLNELSCICIPQNHLEQRVSSSVSRMDDSHAATLPAGVELDNVFVIGTHKPSVEVLSFEPKDGLRVLASGIISLTSAMGTAISGCIPQDVRLVLVDRLYVLSGLRNGMLLRFEWPPASPMCSLQNLGHGMHIGSFKLHTIAASNMTAMSFGQPSHSSGFVSKNIDEIPIKLQLIATRRIGITPVFLVPLSDSLDADIIALSDRLWLLQTGRHGLSYTSISFQPSTHATPVCSAECPEGILFVAENSLHLVEMGHGKRLNVQKFHLGGTARKVLYHKESRLLLVMRTGLSIEACSSDVCCVDPLSGSIVSCFKLELGETAKSMELVTVGNEEVLLIGTSLSSGPAIMPSGEAESTKGRLLVVCLEHIQNSDAGSMTLCSKAGSSSQRTSPFCEISGYAEQLSSSSLCSSPDDGSCEGVKLEETETWQLRLACAASWPGMVLAICPYFGRYFLASAGNAFYVCGFPNDSPQRIRKFAVGRTRFMITTLTANSTRIAVGDCRDGILFYSYNEDARKLEQLYGDPSQRLVADCILIDVETAVVSDRKGSIALLSCSNCSEGSTNPECNLTLSGAYYVGEITMSITKGSFSYKLPADDFFFGIDGIIANASTSHTIMASTMLGSILIFFPLSREEYELLDAVQATLVTHPLTAPILGNDHNEFRSRENKAGVPKILDGDMLSQFLELTTSEQEAILSVPPPRLHDAAKTSSKHSHYQPIPVSQVVQLLERVHYALN